MDEKFHDDPLMQRVLRRQRQQKRIPKWKRMLRKYWPPVRLALLCLALLAVIFCVAKLISGSGEETLPTGAPTTGPTAALTEMPATEPPTTEPPTEEPTIPPVGGVIYLTFDDGPGAETPRLLEILEQYDAKATFFVVNTPFASTIGQIAASGHALAMHTATHDFATIYSSEDAYFADLEKIESVIEEYAGYRPNILRFPGGSSNGVSMQYSEGIMTALTQRVEEKGYIYQDWNVDSDDAGSATTAEEVVRNVIRGCSPRTSSIVLMHDIKSYTIDAIEEILVWGRTYGYTFEAITADTPAVHHTVKN